MRLAVLILALAGFSSLAQASPESYPLSQCGIESSYQRSTVSSTTATQFFSLSISSHVMNGRKQLCFTNLDTTPTDWVHISSYNIVDGISSVSFSTNTATMSKAAAEGAILFGTQTGCFDWGPNHKTFIYQKATLGANDVIGFQCR